MPIDMKQPVTITMPLEDYETAKEFVSKRLEAYARLQKAVSVGESTEDIKKEITAFDEYLAMLMTDALS